ncbi:hypothetical protein TeGR_g3060 [Tetraparma gracilis]|uniref:Uncharacterized protein n=1 Tax=Tetraparma gracilis TaxID=2962635 RepID=A0ABQ6N7W4_9STRA|nr:hypothetical protein TeGR_g3060 [Tetraparma gracilis]
MLPLARAGCCLLLILLLSAPASPLPRPFARARYPHPVTGERLNLQSYVSTLESLLEESQGQTKSLAQRLSSFRARFLTLRGEAREGEEAKSKTREYLEKIEKLQEVVDGLREKVAKSGKSEGDKEREIELIVAQQGEVVRQIKADVLRIYEEEMAEVKAEFARIVDSKVEAERKRGEEEMQKRLGEKDEEILAERAKVLQVLSAVEEAEVKKREARELERRGRLGGRGKAGEGRVGRSAGGKAERVVGGRILNF